MLKPTHHYISAETLLLLFPQLAGQCDTLPYQINDGQRRYDAVAALDKMIDQFGALTHDCDFADDKEDDD